MGFGYQFGHSEYGIRKKIEDFIAEHGYTQAQRALEFAWEKHAGQTRMNGQPFIVHPLFVAHYGILIRADSESQICIGLLHDVCEDCGIEPQDLPFDEEIRRGVEYMTLVYDFDENDDEDLREYKRTVTKNETYARLIEEPRALICKGIDRYHNLNTIEELAEENIIKNVLETHRLLLPVIYSALDLRYYREYHRELNTISYNLENVNYHLARTHGIALNTMI